MAQVVRADRKVCGSNLTSASRLRLSRLRQPGSILTLLFPSGSVAARHQKGVTSRAQAGSSLKKNSTGQWLYWRPPHVLVGTILERSQYIFIKETTHKVAENCSTAHDRFHPFWAHQVGAVPEFPSTQINLVFTEDSSESLVLQLKPTET
ncbi:hypothetical protein CSKR_112515 [Clonorchis sinensis]|uniref:Uncharacterized protein n=1 Tax=Clonorchis sinensis TaxID=79923 RepID=A0A419PS89_CLOSI|nr:hypothetical protein CSKR_112515 [Clonorchis sinensis]